MLCSVVEVGPDCENSTPTLIGLSVFLLANANSVQTPEPTKKRSTRLVPLKSAFAHINISTS
jgi:hypothetical protein